MSTTAEWIDELKSISVLELSERIKALEEEFGVSATAVAAAAPAAAAGDGADAEEESSTVDVILTAPGEKKIQVIKAVRAATGLGRQLAQIAEQGLVGSGGEAGGEAPAETEAPAPAAEVAPEPAAEAPSDTEGADAPAGETTEETEGN